MKRIVFISVIMLFAAVAAFAQDDGQRKMTRKERKALQARVDSMLHARADSAMLDSAFVLEADEVMFKRGYTAHVTSSTNFVSVCGDRAVVQVAFNVPWSGFNGMGGITVEGRISQYERKTDKRGNVYLTMGVLGNGISAQLFITLWAGGNKASVSVQQNFYSGRITLNGVMVPFEESEVFKGMSL